MAYYHVEIGYRTKRSAIAEGMTIKAFGPDEAEEVARARVLDKYPARQWCFTDIREATEADISLGVISSQNQTEDGR